MKTQTDRHVTVNADQALYVIPCGEGYSCLGFKVADRKARAVAAWIAESKTVTLTAEPGTLEHYHQYAAIMEAGARYSAKTGKRCEAELESALFGLEGQRVEVTYPDGRKERFIVGKSTGWMPCHLAIPRRDSSGGIPAYIPDGATVRVVKTRR